MSWRLRIDRKFPFANFQAKREDSSVSILGAPLDISNSHAPGTVYAPEHIRRVAESLEWYSFISQRDLTEFSFYDEGDLVLYPGDIKRSLELISESLSDLKREGRIPIILGGEHTITLGAADILSSKCLIVVFDAHLDLREEYLGSNLNHATVMRRVWENVPSAEFAFVGTRAVTLEELSFAKKEGMEIFTSRMIWKYGLAEAVKKIIKMAENTECVYISFDMDVVDPGFAPGVGTPEPLGLDPHTIVEMVYSLIGKKLVGMDIVEVNPLRDCGEATTSLAAKIVIESIIKYESSKIES
ncbi:MAG: agmatinase [Fervidicoccaceae archaeon]|jgi:agmatinase